METWTKVLKDLFRKVRVFTIYKKDNLIISKKSLSLKTSGSGKSTFKLFSLTNQLHILYLWF